MLSVAQSAAGDFSFILHRVDPLRVIPEEPKETVGYVDSFGNIKTTYRTGDKVVAALGPRTRVKVRIGAIVRTATVATGSFNVMEGDLAFAPGSSGYERRYWELFKRGGSAWHEFENPATGSKIQIDVA